MGNDNQGSLLSFDESNNVVKAELGVQRLFGLLRILEIYVDSYSGS